MAKKENNSIVIKVIGVICFISLGLELFLHRHSHFAESGWMSLDGKFSFFAVLGLLSAVVMIVIAKLLGTILKVKEDYYD